MQKENLVEISGTVETVVYKNEETGFAVLELDKDGELITVVGELAAVGEGEILTLHGNFRTHPSYGTQFKAVRLVFASRIAFLCLVVCCVGLRQAALNNVVFI